MSNLLNLLEEFKIVIPPIQRDYAQGRNSGKIPIIRERFIESIFNTLANDNSPALELDFIYGYTESDNIENDAVKVFKPLDGQQRLTTLFLIHWFVANQEGKTIEAKPSLKRFTYATRQTSRSFCDKLIDFEIDFNNTKKVDEQIINQPWFYSNWENDPTIQSMLVVLRAIQEKFVGLNDTWEKFSGDNPRIIFHLLSMNDLGLPDDLYIKMNARGKPLTDFEHFKSSFSEILNEKNAKYFNEKIDGEWADLFWGIFKNKENKDIAKLVDAGFLNFFWYITDILIQQKDISFSNDFWLNKIKIVYYNQDENVKFLFDSLDLFLGISKQNDCPFEKIFYLEDSKFDITKTKLFFVNAKRNLFHKCVVSYSQGNNFVIREQLLLYGFIKIKLNNSVVPDNFYRITRNLLENASDKEVRYENLKNLYLAIDALIFGERRPENLLFTKRQLAEESTKEKLLATNLVLKEIIYKLEDHLLLRGTVGVFLINDTIGELGGVFLNVFHSDCNYFEISKAMLKFGFYPQHNGGYYRFGNRNNSVWREILTQSENRTGFEKTKEVLRSYLDFKKSNPNISDVEIANNFLCKVSTQKDISYYYLKYNSFVFWGNNQTEGFYWWQNFSEHPYECTMLFRTNFRGRSWSPFLLEISTEVNNCTIEQYNSSLQFTKDNLIILLNHTDKGFKFSCPTEDNYSTTILNQFIANGNLNQDGYLLIEQDDNGIDQEDRIEKCIEFLNGINLN
jgi:hypothetical protein